MKTWSMLGRTVTQIQLKGSTTIKKYNRKAEFPKNIKMPHEILTAVSRYKRRKTSQSFR